MESLKKVLSVLQKAEEIIMVVAFVVMVCCMFGSVIARNILKASIPWFDELARFTMVYMVLLGAEAGLRDGTQVCVTAVTDMLKGKVKKAVAIVAKAILTIFCALMAVGSINAVTTNISRGVTSTSLNWPMAVPYMALVIGFVAATLVQAGTTYEMIRSFNNKEEEA